MRQTNYAKSIFLLLLMFSLCLIFVILKLAASFFIPLTISFLLAFVLYPLCKKMNAIHIPWILCIAITVLAAIGISYVVCNILIASAGTLLDAFPRYESRFEYIYRIFAETMKIPYDEDSSLITNIFNSLEVRKAVQDIVLELSSGLISTVKRITLILLFVVFLLLELKSFSKKLSVAFSEKSTNDKIMSIARKIIEDVTRYISIKFLASLATGFLVFLTTFVCKMDFAVIWGFVAFVLNFIPNFGSIASWLLTTLFAVLQFYPNWAVVFFISVAIIVINMVIGNFIEPRWEGKDLGLSPFVILVSLSFWSWMWGFIGMILCVPIMVIIKIIFENISFLQPIAILLGNSRQKNSSELSSENTESVISQQNATCPPESGHPLP